MDANEVRSKQFVFLRLHSWFRIRQRMQRLSPIHARQKNPSGTNRRGTNIRMAPAAGRMMMCWAVIP